VLHDFDLDSTAELINHNNNEKPSTHCRGMQSGTYFRIQNLRSSCLRHSTHRSTTPYLAL